MKYTMAHELCTDPVMALDDRFHHLSYALFRTDECFGQTVALRFPDRNILGEGALLQCALGLSDEAVAYLISDDAVFAPLFVKTELAGVGNNRAGVAILSKRYVRQMGLGLLLHIHARPDATAKLLAGGVLGRETGVAFSLCREIRDALSEGRSITAEDADSFAALLDAWQMAGVIERGFFTCREDGSMSLSALWEGICTLASFVGCAVELEGTTSDLDGRLVKCYRPAVAEALLFYILSEAREHGRDRRVTCRLGGIPGPDGDRLSIRFHYPMYREELPVRVRERLEKTRLYLREAAFLSGLSVDFPPLAVPKSRRGLYHRPLPDHGIYVEWHEDPRLLPSGDLKARLRLLRCRYPDLDTDEARLVEAFERSETLACREKNESLEA